MQKYYLHSIYSLLLNALMDKTILDFLLLQVFDSCSNSLEQSCKSGGALLVGFGPGSGLTFRKTLGLFRARCDACE